MPKLYTSPFWVPWGGCRSYMSSSGAVQSFSEKPGTVRKGLKYNRSRRFCEWKDSVRRPNKWTRLTCIECVRVIVFAGRAEAGQAIIRDFQNKSTVHHAIRWLQISMAANVAVVEIVHSLVERSVKSSIKGCSLPLSLSRPPFFPPQQIIHENTQIQTYGNNTLWQVDVCWGFWKEAVFQGRHSHGGISVKLLLIPLGRGRRVLSVLMFDIWWKRWVKRPSKLHRRLFSAERCYLCGDI